MKKMLLVYLNILFFSVLSFAQNESEQSILQCKVQIPNTFSVLNGKTNAMEITVTEVKELRLTIFDRWGAKVFESDIAVNYLPSHIDPDGNQSRIIDSGWDAKKQGNSLEEGSYFIIAETTCLEGEQIRNQSSINLRWIDEE